MEYTDTQLRNIADKLRERYPIGTRVKLLHMGNDDPDPIPPGTKGTIDWIDDASHVNIQFDNGRNLGMVYGVDHFRALSQREVLEEKCARNYDKYFDAVHRDIFADVNLDRFAEEIEKANDNYTIEILKQLHDKFVEIYDTDNIDELVGFIQVPAIVEALQTGDYYPALVTLDLDSSGEHWGTCVMTPTGVIDHGVTEETEAEKAFMQNLVPYRYWYTVTCENDIHVDMADCPEDIGDIISAATGQSFEQNGGMSL